MEEPVIHYIFLAIHLAVGAALVYITMKAYKKTKYPPMALLAVGFFLIGIGDTILGDVLSFMEQETVEIIAESVEIIGFIVLILAVKRS